MSDLRNEVHDIDKRLVHIEAVLDRLEKNHLAHMEVDMRDLKSGLEKTNGWIIKGVVAFYGQLALMGLSVIGYLISVIVSML